MKKTALLIMLMFMAGAVFCAANKVSGLPKHGGEVLVIYKNVFSEADISGFLKNHPSKDASRVSIISTFENYYGLTKQPDPQGNTLFVRYKIADPGAMDTVLSALKSEALVADAQPNFIRHALYMGDYPLIPGGPNDTFYQNKNQWGFSQVRADKAFAAGLIPFTASPVKVTVAVLDTGIYFNHVDLIGVTVTGRNILSPGDEPLDDDTGSRGGHGTRLSGIIAANTNNSGIGIAGSAYCNVTWTSRVVIMPVKVLDATGSGTDSDIYEGIVWAVDNGAKVINLSLGSPDGGIILQTAVNYAYDNNVVVVATTGNDASQTFFPAGYSTVIAVGATDLVADINGNTHDISADFSNFGKVDVSAPGVDIKSCMNSSTTSYSVLGDMSSDGTSYASPFVAGLAGLILLKYPGLNPGEVRDIITKTSDDAGAAGYDKYFGWGRVNFYRALTLDKKMNINPSIKTFNWPNPFSPEMEGFTNIVFIPEKAGNIKITIYDGGGDVVWENDINSGAVTPGAYNTVKWDGLNKEARKVANGTYFYVVKQGSGLFGKNKITVLH